MDAALNYLAGIGLYETVGVAGFVCYIAAFGAVQLGLMDGNRLSYSLLNLLAACLVGISLIAEFNLASALIQGSWIVISLIGLTLRFCRVFPAQRPPNTQRIKAGSLR